MNAGPSEEIFVSVEAGKLYPDGLEGTSIQCAVDNVARKPGGRDSGPHEFYMPIVADGAKVCRCRERCGGRWCVGDTDLIDDQRVSDVVRAILMEYEALQVL